jgi:hypothetical protein
LNAETNVGPDTTAAGDETFKKPELAGEVAQVVECLPSKCEVLSSSPSTNNNNKKRLKSLN